MGWDDENKEGEIKPLHLYQTFVLPEWIDYNGHMSEPYYVLVFGHATDAFYDHLGLGDSYRRRTNTSIYTLEAHINYLSEAHEGERLNIETQILGIDAKRIKLFHTMIRDDDGVLLATTELMLMHVDKRTMRSSPFPADAAQRIAEVAAIHSQIPAPENSGRKIELP